MCHTDLLFKPVTESCWPQGLECEAPGIGTNSSKSEATVLNQKKRLLPLQVIRINAFKVEFKYLRFMVRNKRKMEAGERERDVD